MTPAYLTAAAAARALDVEPRTVQRWARSGRIEGARLHGRDWLIPADSLRALQRDPRGRKRKAA